MLKFIGSPPLIPAFDILNIVFYLAFVILSFGAFEFYFLY